MLTLLALSHAVVAAILVTAYLCERYAVRKHGAEEECPLRTYSVKRGDRA